jgi:hypothetical protein
MPGMFSAVFLTGIVGEERSPQNLLQPIDFEDELDLLVQAIGHG